MSTPFGENNLFYVFHFQSVWYFREKTAIFRAKWQPKLSKCRFLQQKSEKTITLLLMKKCLHRKGLFSPCCFYFFPTLALVDKLWYNDYRMAKRRQKPFRGWQISPTKSRRGFLFLYHWNRNRQISWAKFACKSEICCRNSKISTFDCRYNVEKRRYTH